MLAIDLGKTACRGAIGNRRAVGDGAPGLAGPSGVRAAEVAILVVARKLLLDNEIDQLTDVVVGAAGALTAPLAARALGEALMISLRVERVVVTSDYITAHAGALGGKPGVVLIAGTGAIAAAISANGALRTSDGWGPWLGDEGSGAWIGAAGLRAALRAFDNRGPATTLTDAARARFGPPKSWPAQFTSAATLASFAPDVLTADHDPVAAAIVDTAAQSLADTARSAGDGPIAMVGGLAATKALRDRIECVDPLGDALDGAVRLGQIHEPHVIRIHAHGTASDLDALPTESARPEFYDLDTRPISDIVEVLIAAEGAAHAAVVAALPQIAAAAENITAQLESGGRLIYAGAGTPGRLGILDATECGPTFDTDSVRGVIAGGPAALTQSIEGAEDEFDPAAFPDLTANDAVVGITASGRTPYVLAALQHARSRGALTVAVVNNPGSRAEADIMIELLTGPEVLAGSTRLTAGTTQKVVLNTLSTSVMIRLGKAYGAHMVDVRATNAKLRRRAIRIVRQAADVDEESAAAALAAAGGHAKTAIVALLAGVNAAEAARRLEKARGHIRIALGAPGCS